MAQALAPDDVVQRHADAAANARVPLLVLLLLVLVLRLPPLALLLRVPMRVEITSMGGKATVDCSVRPWSRSWARA